MKFDNSDGRGWICFGKIEFRCAGMPPEDINYYEENEELPTLCDECYKGLIFWEKYFSNENTERFLQMLDSLEENYRGKYNSGVVVFYFREKMKMLNFLEQLKVKMKEFNVEGYTQWRRACKDFQELKPEWWPNAKTFAPSKCFTSIKTCPNCGSNRLEKFDKLSEGMGIDGMTEGELAEYLAGTWGTFYCKQCGNSIDLEQ